MNKVLVILRKEWLDIRLQRGLLLGIVLPPVLLTLLPIAAFSISAHIPGSAHLNGVNASTLGMENFTSVEFAQALIGKQFSVLYLLLPLIVPSVIAAYSIVGEKTSRTLEPLLATPVRVWELLLGKSLSALIPALLVTWICGIVFIVGCALLAVSGRVFASIITPGWLLVLVLWTPLLALIAIAVMVAVSSRVNDPRTAQQVSAWVVVPFMTLFLGQISGLIVLGTTFALSVFVVLILLAILTIWAAGKLFQREVILTNWK